MGPWILVVLAAPAALTFALPLPRRAAVTALGLLASASISKVRAGRLESGAEAA